MDEVLYNKILNDYHLAREFKKETVNVYRGRELKSLDELGEVFHEIDGKYTLEDGKEFIHKLSSNQSRWYLGSNPRYAISISFVNLENNKIKIKINRKQYFN